MPDIEHVTRPSSNPTVEIIRRAVNAAHAASLTVSTVPDLGVHCTSGHGRRWEVEQRVQVVSPLGAVLLALQPQISDADAALAHALSVNVLWVIGFADGCGGEKKAQDITGPAARLYAEGYVAGIEFRAVMHKRAGVPVERADDRTPAEAPAIGADIARMQVSDVLEALARSIPARGWPVDDAAEAVEAFNEWARDYRRDGR